MFVLQNCFSRKTRSRFVLFLLNNPTLVYIYDFIVWTEYCTFFDKTQYQNILEAPYVFLDLID